MIIGSFFLSAFFLFVIIYFAVRLAIKPLIYKQAEFTTTEKLGLVKLRDIEVLSNIQLEEVIEMYQKKAVKKEDDQQYQKYERVLNELKKIGYFTEEQYFGSLDKLKKYFNVD